MAEPLTQWPVALLATALSVATTSIIFYIQRRETRVSRSRDQLYRFFMLLTEARSEIEAVLRLENKPYSRWEKEDKDAALAVCVRLHLIARLMLEDMLHEDVLSIMWYYSIPKCYMILTPYLIDIRHQRDRYYWLSIEQLVFRVLRNTVTYEFRPVDRKELSELLAQWEKARAKGPPLDPSNPQPTALPP